MNKYLLEIKNRFLLLVITWFSTLIIGYSYKEIILFNILNQNSFNLFYFIFTDVTEILMVYLNVIFFLGYQTLYLYLLYHSFIFLIPAFFKIEYYHLKIIFKTVIFTYFISVYFFYYILLPITLSFFMKFHHLLIYVHFEAKIIEYSRFFLLFYQGCMLYLQFLALLLLIFNFLITKQTIKRLRKLFYYLFLIIVTLICPPELIIQIYISLFITLIYEIVVLVFLLKLNCFIVTFNDNMKKDSF